MRLFALALLLAAPASAQSLDPSSLSLYLTPPSTALLDIRADTCGTTLVDRRGAVITTARNSTATYWCGGTLLTAPINAPRVETDPVTGVTGLLVEPTRTNSALNSNAHSLWSVEVGVSVPIDASAACPIGPLGTRMNLIVFPAVDKGAYQLVTAAAGPWAHSAWMARATGDAACTAQGPHHAASGAAGNNQISVPDTPVRVSSTWTSTGSQGPYYVIRTGDTCTRVCVQASQYEAGAYATSNIPTTTGAVQRLADVVTAQNPAGYTNESGCARLTTWLLPGASLTGSMRALGPGTVFFSGATQMGLYDESTVVAQNSSSVYSPVDVASSWSGSMQTIRTLMGSSSSSYDGTMIGSSVPIGSESGALNTLAGHINNLRLYKSATGCRP